MSAQEMSFDSLRYLERIGHAGSTAVGHPTLVELMGRHLRAVPFENLDIHLGRQLDLGRDALFAKIVTRRRGGFCYELNGLFAELLEALGFDVRLLSARVVGANGDIGPPFDHLALEVHSEGRWLVDVGFGDAFIAPLDLDSRDVAIQRGIGHRLTEADDGALLYQMLDGDEVSDQYLVSPEPRVLDDFKAMCHHHSHSPESPFTNKRVCTLLTATGRVTVTPRKVIVTTAETAERSTSPLVDDDEWHRALMIHCGVVL